MKTNDISQRLELLIVEQFGVETSKCTDSARFIDDLGADSLDVVELAMRLEEEFAIEISDVKAQSIQTVEDAKQFLTYEILGANYAPNTASSNRNGAPNKPKRRAKNLLSPTKEKSGNRMLKFILSREIYKEYYDELGLSEKSTYEIMHSVIGGMKIDFHSTIPNLRDGIIWKAIVIIICDKNVFQFDLMKGKVSYTSFNMGEFDLTWDFQTTKSGKIDEVTMKVVLPNSEKLISNQVETFDFHDADAVSKSMKFLQEFSKKKFGA